MKITPRAGMLQAYVDAAADQPVVWGASDCSAWAAAWVQQITRRMPPLPVYTSHDEAHALIAAAGGLVPLWDRALGDIDIWPTSTPELGDVAVFDTRNFGPVGIVMANGGIGYWRGEIGAKAIRPRGLLRAWRVV